MNAYITPGPPLKIDRQVKLIYLLLLPFTNRWLERSSAEAIGSEGFCRFVLYPFFFPCIDGFQLLLTKVLDEKGLQYIEGETHGGCLLTDFFYS